MTGVRPRVESVDVVRGLIMILMALDHVRDFFGSLAVNPTDLATTTAPLFFTRWITHICAPVFFLLTGTGAYLALRRREAAACGVVVELFLGRTGGQGGQVDGAYRAYRAYAPFNAPFAPSAPSASYALSTYGRSPPPTCPLRT